MLLPTTVRNYDCDELSFSAVGDEDRRAAEEDLPKRAGSALPDGFFDDPRAQQVVEDELTKAAFARLSDARAPSTSAPLSVPVVSAVEYVSLSFSSIRLTQRCKVIMREFYGYQIAKCAMLQFAPIPNLYFLAIHLLTFAAKWWQNSRKR